jgi:hypothetical protein
VGLGKDDCSAVALKRLGDSFLKIQEERYGSLGYRFRLRHQEDGIFLRRQSLLSGPVLGLTSNQYFVYIT